MTDTLGKNNRLSANQNLISPNGQTRLAMQGDGNLVLYGPAGKTLWTSGTVGRGSSAFLQWNGELHVDDRNSHAVWSSKSAGDHKDCFLRIHNDGSMFIWDGSNHQIWDTGTTGFKVNPVPGGNGKSHTDFGGVGKFLDEAASAAGHTVQDVARVSSDAIHIATPFVQMALTMIPALGPVAAGAIGTVAGTLGAGLAFASGKNISDSLIDGLGDVIPGGILATAVLKMGVHAVEAGASGKPIDQALLGSLPIPDIAKQAVNTVTTGLAQGLHIDSPQLRSALNVLPINLQGSFKVGVMLGNTKIQNGATLQTIASDPNILIALEHTGITREATDPVAASGRKTAINGTRGYDIGIGSMIVKQTTAKLTAIRNQLQPNDKKGFDIALSLHIGTQQIAGNNTAINAKLTPLAAAGAAITVGMQKAPMGNRVAMMTNIAANPTARVGAVTAVKTLAIAKESWIHKILKFVGLAS